MVKIIVCNNEQEVLAMEKTYDVDVDEVCEYHHVSKEEFYAHKMFEIVDDESGFYVNLL